jgi:hypothetical protein
MSARWVSAMMDGLPLESNIMSHLSEHEFTIDQHLSANIYDALCQLYFQSSISAAVAAGEQYSTLRSQAPKPMPRPGQKPKDAVVKEKEKIAFTPTKKLQAIFGQTNVSIAHSKSCIESRINEGGQKLQCFCPPKI